MDSFMVGRGSRQIVSLWDMLQFYADKFVAAVDALATLGQLCHGLRVQGTKTVERTEIQAGDQDIAHATFLLEHLTELNLPVSAKAAEKLVKAMQGSPINVEAMNSHVRSVNERLKDELGSRLFLYVPHDVSSYFQDASPPFGPEVEAKFTATSEDVVEAGKCLALGRATAAVFHLMRVMEGAVQILCATLNIPNPDREWGKLLSDLHSKIEAMPKGEQRDNWSETHVLLYHVKQAWRNATMHPKQTYTEEQAQEVWRAVRTFMRQMAQMI